MTRTAACRCGQLQAVCEGEPVRVSVCHCLDCQRRSGSAFAAQARFPAERVSISGASAVWTAIGDSGRWGRFRFCPTCGSTIAYEIEAMPDIIAIPLGVFADPDFPHHPRFSVYEERKHPWVAITGHQVEHHD